jgi:hypothetical protein
MTKEVDKEIFTDFILNFYGQINIGRSIPNELDVLIITYNDDDKERIECDILDL